MYFMQKKLDDKNWAIKLNFKKNISMKAIYLKMVFSMSYIQHLNI